MKKRFARLAAGLALGTLAATGITLADNLVATPDDTAWGAPADNSGDTTVPASAVDTVTTTVTPLDTAWG